MQAHLRILSPECIPHIIEDAFQFMIKPGIKVQLKEVRVLLADSGTPVDEDQQVAKL